MKQEDEVLELLKKNGIILKGHFKLSSGLQSEYYIQCAKIFEQPLLSIKILEILALKVVQKFTRGNFDTILSPAMGGIICGYELARHLLCKNIFVERVDNIFALRRGFEIKKNERILLVEDVITTGKSSLEAAKVAQHMGGIIIGAASIINRQKNGNTFPFPLVSVLEMKIDTFSPEDVPSHLKAVPPIKPGSRKG